MGLFVIGVLLGLTMFYVFALSAYAYDLKQRIKMLETEHVLDKAITKREECAKDQKSIANDTVKGNDDEHNN